jgi:hypothetical protein
MPPISILGQTGVMRSFKPEDRFQIPDVYEIFFCNDEDGSFRQIAGPMVTIELANDALGAFMKHPDFKNKKVFIVRVERFPVAGNFAPSLIQPAPLIRAPIKGSA